MSRKKGFKHSEETKQKQRKGNLGKHISEETKQKQREAKLGKIRKPFTEEHKKHLREANLGQVSGMKGKHHTEESKQKQREVHLGQVSGMKGKHHTEEAKIKIGYNHPDQIGENSPRWKGGEEASRRRTEKQRRGLGFIPINKNFIGAEGHHIDRDFVIYIPRELHKSIRHSVIKGKNMKEINEAAFAYTYRENRLLGDVTK